MEVKIEDNQLVIKIPLQKPTPSASGKTLVVATTNGFKETAAVVDSKLVKVSVNAFIAR